VYAGPSAADGARAGCQALCDAGPLTTRPHPVTLVSAGIPDSDPARRRSDRRRDESRCRASAGRTSHRLACVEAGPSRHLPEALAMQDHVPYSLHFCRRESCLPDPLRQSSRAAARPASTSVSCRDTRAGRRLRLQQCRAGRGCASGRA
jgi:hypothetical protein